MTRKLGTCLANFLFSLLFTLVLLGLEYGFPFRDSLSAPRESLCERPISLAKDWEVHDRKGKYLGKTDLPKNLSGLSETVLILSKTLTFESIPNCEIGVVLGKVSDALEFRWNGILPEGLIRETDSNLQPEGYDRTRIFYRLPLRKENTIQLRIRAYFPEEIGILSGILVLGNGDRIRKDYYLFQIAFLLLLSVFPFLSLYFLAIGLRERKLSANSYFGAFLLFFFLYSFLNSGWKYELGLPFEICKRIEYCLLPFLFPFFYSFLCSLFEEKISKPAIFLNLWALISFIVFLFSPDIIAMDVWNRKFLQPSWLLYSTLVFRSIWIRIRNGHPDGFGFLGGILVLFLTLGLDIAAVRGILTIPKTSSYSVLALVIASGFRLSGKFIEMKRELELWNSELQKKVQDRTRELMDSLDQIRSLKEKQDGDYFLISLLQKSFAGGTKSYPPFRIETLTSQFKKFEFKGRNLELGGDSVWTEEIELQGRKYLALLNSDAMGKSLQGAAGALLVCSLFRSKILSSKSAYHTPETWIVSVYEELHRLFQAFDGNLFVTGVICLLDAASSSLFLLNSDHPTSVLTRNGIAGFIEDQTNPKMGFPLSSSKTRVIGLELKDRDRVLIGSDGREDLRTRENQEIRCFSEEFLHLASESDSDLQSTRDRLFSLGEFTDDLSLVSIRMESLSAEGKDWSEKRKRKRLAEAISLWKSGRQPESSLLFEDLSASYPMDLDLAYLAAWAFYKVGIFEKARIYSEKILYRYPEKSENLLLLVKIYFKLGQSKDKILEFLSENGLDGESLLRNTINLRKVS